MGNLRGMFTDSFRELRAFQFSKPAPSWEDGQRFHDMLSVIQSRHKRVPGRGLDTPSPKGWEIAVTL